MAARKPGRYLGPIALLAVAAAVFMVVRAHVHTTTHTSTGAPLAGSLVQRPRGQAKSTHHHRGAVTYTVKSGDTLSGITAKTGVPTAQIERLNPGVNPNALQTGQVLKLRR